MICRSIDSLSALLAAYLISHDIKPGSAEQYTITVNLFSRWYEATYRVPFVLPCWTEALLCEFLLALRDAKHSAPKTLNRKRGDLVTLWHYAASRQLVDEPKVKEIIRFREPERIPRAWTQEELARQLAACDLLRARPVPGWDARHDRAVRLVIYDTAFRISACLQLSMLNLRDDGAIVAEAETQKTFCDEDKWLGPDTMAAIRAIEPPARGPIFRWPYQIRAFTDRWKRIVELAGLVATRRDGPQKMRRTSASWMEFASPGSAMAHLRHKTPGLAKKSYIDPLIATPHKAYELLPRICGQQRKLF